MANTGSDPTIQVFFHALNNIRSDHEDVDNLAREITAIQQTAFPARHGEGRLQYYNRLDQRNKVRYLAKLIRNLNREVIFRTQFIRDNYVPADRNDTHSDIHDHYKILRFSIKYRGILNTFRNLIIRRHNPRPPPQPVPAPPFSSPPQGGGGVGGVMCQCRNSCRFCGCRD